MTLQEMDLIYCQIGGNVECSIGAESATSCLISFLEIFITVAELCRDTACARLVHYQASYFSCLPILAFSFLLCLKLNFW